MEPSATRKLKTGQVARWKLSENITDSGYWLPTTALVRGARGLWPCYVLGKSEIISNDYETKKSFRVERRELEVLHTEGDLVFVRGTLKNKDQVIVDGNDHLTTDQLVYSLNKIDYFENF